MGPRGPKGSRGGLAIIVAIVVLAGAAGACGPTATGPTAEPRVAAFDDFFATWCASMQAMLRAVGNPDTGADSVLGQALDEAIEAGDLASAEALAGQIRIELQTGQRLAASATAWAPGAQLASETQRLLAALDAAVVAKQSAAKEGLEMADEQFLAAFAKAGGTQAWTGVRAAGREIEELTRADAPSCPGITG